MKHALKIFFVIHAKDSKTDIHTVTLKVILMKIQELIILEIWQLP